MSSSNNAPIAAAIICGGRARRFDGKSKPLAVIGGSKVIDHQRLALATRCSPLALVAPSLSSLHESLRERIGNPFHFVADAVSNGGPLGGIVAALRWSPTPWLFVVAGDMPWIDPALIDRLNEERGQADVIAPCVDGRLQPLAALYHQRCVERLTQRLAEGKRRLTSLWDNEQTLSSISSVTIKLCGNDKHWVRGFNSRTELAAIQKQVRFPKKG